MYSILGQFKCKRELDFLARPLDSIPLTAFFN